MTEKNSGPDSVKLDGVPAKVRFRGRNSCFGGEFISLYRQQRQVRKVGVSLVSFAPR